MEGIEESSEIIQKGAPVELLKNDRWKRTRLSKNNRRNKPFAGELLKNDRWKRIKQPEVSCNRLHDVRGNVHGTYDPIQRLER